MSAHVHVANEGLAEGICAKSTGRDDMGKEDRESLVSHNLESQFDDELQSLLRGVAVVDFLDLGQVLIGDDAGMPE